MFRCPNPSSVEWISVIIEKSDHFSIVEVSPFKVCNPLLRDEPTGHRQRPRASRVGVTFPVGILEPAAKSEPNIPIGEVQV